MTLKTIKKVSPFVGELYKVQYRHTCYRQYAITYTFVSIIMLHDNGTNLTKII